MNGIAAMYIDKASSIEFIGPACAAMRLETYAPQAVKGKRMHTEAVVASSIKANFSLGMRDRSEIGLIIAPVKSGLK